MFQKLIIIYRWALAMIAMLISGTISIILVILSFGLLRNFCVKNISRYSSRFLLRIIGYGYVLPEIKEFPTHKVLYTINHNSYLDIFLLASLGLPNTRYILSEVTFKYIPLVISAKAMGTFFIPQKKHAKRRLQFFKRVSKILRKNKYSVIASPEGVSEYIHGINPFNKGIFHMAMEARIPIVPLYIHIPKAANVFKGKYAKGGNIHLEILDEIDNSDWKLDNIWDEIAKVRKVYLDKFNEINNITII